MQCTALKASGTSHCECMGPQQWVMSSRSYRPFPMMYRGGLRKAPGGPRGRSIQVRPHSTRYQTSNDTALKTHTSFSIHDGGSSHAQTHASCFQRIPLACDRKASILGMLSVEVNNVAQRDTTLGEIHFKLSVFSLGQHNAEALGA